MTTLHLLLVAAAFLCVNAQTISPTDLQGQVGDNVVFECTSFLVNDTDNTLVEFRTASETGFSVLDNINNPRLNRSDSGSITTYTYGPLTPEDNNAVFRCQSSSRPTAGATISVVFAAMISAVTPSNQSFTFRENNQQALVINITVDGNPAPTYTWTRDGVAVVNSTAINVTRTSFRAYAVRENRGDYVVTYQNTVGNDMHSFSLDILFQSTFPAMAGQGVNCTPVGQDFVCSTQPGTTVMLNCNVDANPPATVTFSPQGVNTVGNTIVISNFTEAANYSCTATNEGFDPVTRNFRLVVGDTDFSTSTTIPPTAQTTDVPEIVPIRCPLGTYQPESQGDCLPCPRNTNTSTNAFKNATICPCSSGYFRTNFEGPEIDCTRPPSTCRNIIAISVEEQTVNISWSKPDDTGRDDFYYVVEYSDGESVGSVPVVSEERVVQYSIGGLRPATDYTFTVTVENGVSDQDAQNEYLRRCELKLTTQEGKPSPPNDFQSLCDVIVWGMPSNPNGDITAYEAQFYIPGTENSRLVEIAQDRTFYVVREEDKLGGDTSTFVRVRAKSRAGGGKWSNGKSLGTVCPPCDSPNDQLLPTTVSPTIGSVSTEKTGTSAPISSVYFSLGGQVYGNNSVLSLTDIGEGSSALLCKTNLSNCCKNVPFRFGQFYYPDGEKVPIRSGGSGFYRDRGDQEIRLNRRDGITSPAGKFRCEIPDAEGVSQNLIITLV